MSLKDEFVIAREMGPDADPEEAKQTLGIIQGWQNEAGGLAALLEPRA